MNVEFAEIKLIVWDLDECFWQGTLSEGDVSLADRNRRLVIRLSERGIVNSVCSKNDPDKVREKLREYGLSEYFVFTSVDWQPKGERIRDMICSMNLRPENVLFVDDNISNQKEAEFYCPGLMTAFPDVIDALMENVGTMGKDDAELSRLAQYRQMETKFAEQRKYSTNEEFLFDSRIRVEILRDVAENEGRLYELALRTNQLNFTKRRVSETEFHDLLLDPSVACGYVTAKDRYGEYGIVGFYAVKDQKLVHFLFSCRTMGMGIEQYVYAALDYPQIAIKEPVSGSLATSGCPPWINVSGAGDGTTRRLENVSKARAIFKGPCDLEAITAYLRSDSIESEVVYIDNLGRQVEIQCATQNIVNCLSLTEEDIEYLKAVMPFFDDNVFRTKIFDPIYDVVILSIVADFNFGVYRHKSREIAVALGQNFRDITDRANWQDYVDGRIFNGNYRLSLRQLEAFAKDFHKVDWTAADTIGNLQFILDHISSRAKLVVVLGSECDLEKFNFGNYVGRADKHKKANVLIKKHFAGNNRVSIIEPQRHITGEGDYGDANINHYSKRVIFGLADDISRVLNECGINPQRNSSIEALARKSLRVFRRRISRYLGNTSKQEKIPAQKR